MDENEVADVVDIEVYSRDLADNNQNEVENEEGEQSEEDEEQYTRNDVVRKF